MQNAGLALGIIAVQSNSDLGIVTIASLWGIWHIVSGMALPTRWRKADKINYNIDNSLFNNKVTLNGNLMLFI